MSMSMSNTPVLHAYRHVLRQGLRAIKFSKPARYTLRDRVRLAFRKSPANDFDPGKIENTLEFLRGAEEFNGLEHSIVKGLLRVWWDQDLARRSKFASKTPNSQELQLRVTAYDAFNHNIRMLNESMGMCIPSMTTRVPS